MIKQSVLKVAIIVSGQGSWHAKFNVNLASNRMVGHTDAASSVVPIAVL